MTLANSTKGDIVSQDAELTAKIIDWVLEVSNPEIPKLFKLTAAVTSIDQAPRPARRPRSRAAAAE